MRRGSFISQVDPVAVPRTGDEIAEAARARGLVIPDPCAAGVAANLSLLARHAERLRADPAGEPS